MALDDFRFVMRFRVSFHDIDMLQHVNNAAYVVWLETVRCNYFEQVLGGSLASANSMIVARLEMNYERALDYREDVAVGCRVSRIGRKSFDVAFEIWSETRHERAVYGSSTMVAYSYESRTSIQLPERWRQVIEEYELVAPTV